MTCATPEVGHVGLLMNQKSTFPVRLKIIRRSATIRKGNKQMIILKLPQHTGSPVGGHAEGNRFLFQVRHRDSTSYPIQFQQTKGGDHLTLLLSNLRIHLSDRSVLDFLNSSQAVNSSPTINPAFCVVTPLPLRTHTSVAEQPFSIF